MRKKPATPRRACAKSSKRSRDKTKNASIKDYLPTLSKRRKIDRDGEQQTPRGDNDADSTSSDDSATTSMIEAANSPDTRKPTGKRKRSPAAASPSKRKAASSPSLRKADSSARPRKAAASASPRMADSSPCARSPRNPPKAATPRRVSQSSRKAGSPSPARKKACTERRVAELRGKLRPADSPRRESCEDATTSSSDGSADEAESGASEVGKVASTSSSSVQKKLPRSRAQKSHTPKSPSSIARKKKFHKKGGTTTSFSRRPQSSRDQRRSADVEAADLDAPSDSSSAGASVESSPSSSMFSSRRPSSQVKGANKDFASSGIAPPPVPEGGIPAKKKFLQYKPEFKLACIDYQRSNNYTATQTIKACNISQTAYYAWLKDEDALRAEADANSKIPPPPEPERRPNGSPKYTLEFKVACIEYMRRHGLLPTQIAKACSISTTSMFTWIAREESLRAQLEEREREENESDSSVSSSSVDLDPSDMAPPPVPTRGVPENQKFIMYEPQFKLACIEYHREHGYTVPQTSSACKIGQTTFYAWLKAEDKIREEAAKKEKADAEKEARKAAARARRERRELDVSEMAPPPVPEGGIPADKKYVMYKTEFKLACVDYQREHGYTVNETVKACKISSTAYRFWLKQEAELRAEAEAAVAPPPVPAGGYPAAGEVRTYEAAYKLAVVEWHKKHGFNAVKSAKMCRVGKQSLRSWVKSEAAIRANAARPKPTEAEFQRRRYLQKKASEDAVDVSQLAPPPVPAGGRPGDKEYTMYTPEFKLACVDYMRCHNYTTRQAVKACNVSETAFRNWCKQETELRAVVESERNSDVAARAAPPPHSFRMYSDAYRRTVVEWHEENACSVPRTTRHFNIAPATLRKWLGTAASSAGAKAKARKAQRFFTTAFKIQVLDYYHANKTKLSKYDVRKQFDVKRATFSGWLADEAKIRAALEEERVYGPSVLVAAGISDAEEEVVADGRDVNAEMGESDESKEKSNDRRSRVASCSWVSESVPEQRIRGSVAAESLPADVEAEFKSLETDEHVKVNAVARSLLLKVPCESDERKHVNREESRGRSTEETCGSASSSSSKRQSVVDERKRSEREDDEDTQELRVENEISASEAPQSADDDEDGSDYEFEIEDADDEDAAAVRGSSVDEDAAPRGEEAKTVSQLAPPPVSSYHRVSNLQNLYGTEFKIACLDYQRTHGYSNSQVVTACKISLTTLLRWQKQETRLRAELESKEPVDIEAVAETEDDRAVLMAPMATLTHAQKRRRWHLRAVAQVTAIDVAKMAKPPVPSGNTTVGGGKSNKYGVEYQLAVLEYQSEHGYSDVEVAKACAISVGTLRRWQRNEASIRATAAKVKSRPAPPTRDPTKIYSREEKLEVLDWHHSRSRSQTQTQSKFGISDSSTKKWLREEPAIRKGYTPVPVLEAPGKSRRASGFLRKEKLAVVDWYHANGREKKLTARMCGVSIYSVKKWVEEEAKLREDQLKGLPEPEPAPVERRQFTNAWKVKALDYYHANGTDRRKTCEHFDLSASTFRRWLMEEAEIRKLLDAAPPVPSSSSTADADRVGEEAPDSPPEEAPVNPSGEAPATPSEEVPVDPEEALVNSPEEEAPDSSAAARQKKDRSTSSADSSVRYDDAFKRRVVAWHAENGHTLSDTARRCKISLSTLRHWRHLVEHDMLSGGAGSGKDGVHSGGGGSGAKLKSSVFYDTAFKVKVLDWYHANGRVQRRTCFHFNISGHSMTTWLRREEYLRAELEQRQRAPHASDDLQFIERGSYSVGFKVRVLDWHHANSNSNKATMKYCGISISSIKSWLWKEAELRREARGGPSSADTSKQSRTPAASSASPAGSVGASYSPSSTPADPSSAPASPSSAPAHPPPASSSPRSASTNPDKVVGRDCDSKDDPSKHEASSSEQEGTGSTTPSEREGTESVTPSVYEGTKVSLPRRMHMMNVEEKVEVLVFYHGVADDRYRRTTKKFDISESSVRSWLKREAEIRADARNASQAKMAPPPPAKPSKRPYPLSYKLAVVEWHRKNARTSVDTRRACGVKFDTLRVWLRDEGAIRAALAANKTTYLPRTRGDIDTKIRVLDWHKQHSDGVIQHTADKFGVSANSCYNWLKNEARIRADKALIVRYCATRDVASDQRVAKDDEVATPSHRRLSPSRPPFTRAAPAGIDSDVSHSGPSDFEVSDDEEATVACTTKENVSSRTRSRRGSVSSPPAPPSRVPSSSTNSSVPAAKLADLSRVKIKDVATMPSRSRSPPPDYEAEDADLEVGASHSPSRVEHHRLSTASPSRRDGRRHTPVSSDSGRGERQPFEHSPPRAAEVGALTTESAPSRSPEDGDCPQPLYGNCVSPPKRSRGRSKRSPQKNNRSPRKWHRSPSERSRSPRKRARSTSRDSQRKASLSTHAEVPISASEPNRRDSSPETLSHRHSLAPAQVGQSRVNSQHSQSPMLPAALSGSRGAPNTKSSQTPGASPGPPSFQGTVISSPTTRAAASRISCPAPFSQQTPRSSDKVPSQRLEEPDYHALSCPESTVYTGTVVSGPSKISSCEVLENRSVPSFEPLDDIHAFHTQSNHRSPPSHMRATGGNPLSPPPPSSPAPHQSPPRADAGSRSRALRSSSRTPLKGDTHSHRDLFPELGCLLRARVDTPIPSGRSSRNTSEPPTHSRSNSGDYTSADTPARSQDTRSRHHFVNGSSQDDTDTSTRAHSCIERPRTARTSQRDRSRHSLARTRDVTHSSSRERSFSPSPESLTARESDAKGRRRVATATASSLRHAATATPSLRHHLATSYSPHHVATSSSPHHVATSSTRSPHHVIAPEIDIRECASDNARAPPPRHTDASPSPAAVPEVSPNHRHTYTVSLRGHGQSRSLPHRGGILRGSDNDTGDEEPSANSGALLGGVDPNDNGNSVRIHDADNDDGGESDCDSDCCSELSFASFVGD